MSAILSADDLNDFISPGVACIKPVTQPKSELNPQHVDSSSTISETGEVEIQIDSQGNPLEISQIDTKINKADPSSTALTPAQISLADCLACSGCITSAEEVLVAQHSHHELLKAMEESSLASGTEKVFVASISQQLRASLAMAYDMSIEEMDKLLINLFVNQMGFQYVVGTSLGRKLSLINESQGMIHRKEEGKTIGENLKNPVLSSICPGWVLYAEKTHPYVLPYISTVKSAQQITGCLLKNLTAYERGIGKSKVYHLTIMPCFDKKLESARPELFANQDGADNVPDVDCVLTARELVTLIDESLGKYQLVPKVIPQTLLKKDVAEVYKSAAPTNWPFVQYSWSNDPGSSSGGYAYTYLRLFQEQLITTQNYRPEDFSMKVLQGKNTDVYEMRLLHNGNQVASSAIVNGFRNIQNLVRKLKPSNNNNKVGGLAIKVNPLVARRRARMSKSENSSGASASSMAPAEIADPSKVDYVEIMACPQGCINGGGQIAAPAPTSTPPAAPAPAHVATSTTDVKIAIVLNKDWVSEVLIKYNSVPMFDLSLHPEEIAGFIQWSQEFEKEFDVSEQRLFKTHFNEIEKPTDATAIMVGSKW